MSEKNFVAYGDAESILTGYANRIKQSPTTFVGTQAQWDALSLSQKAEYTLVDITDDEFSPSSFVDWESYGKLGAKNVCPICVGTTTLNGVTFTVNSDGTISATGTATEFTAFDIATTDMGYVLEDGNYILSDGLEEHSTDQYSTITIVDQNDVVHYDYANTKDADNDVFSIENSNIKKLYVAICIGDGHTVSNLVFKPMIRLTTDSNEIYQPYAMTNKELTKQVAPIDDMNNILGAKNLLPNNATTQVLNGITFTVNADGSITANGTANADTWLWLRSYAQGGLYLPTGRYIINGSVSEASDAYNWSVYVVIAGESTNLATDWGHDANGVEFENTSTSNRLISAIWIKSGAVLNNLLFKPMIRPASIKDATYIPYSKTNSELTVELSNFEKKFNTKVSMTVQPNTTYFNTASSQSCAALKIGYLVVMNLVLSVKDNVTVPANTLACTITNVGAISANSSIFIGGNGTSNITRLMLSRNQSNSDNLDVYFIDSYSNSSMRASLVFMVNTIV